MVVRSWRSVLWGYHVIDGEGNAGTSSRRQAAIVCELRKPLVQDKYSVKAKAQQLMYGFMGYILYFDRGYLFSGVVVTAVRSNWLRAPQDLNACDWVPSFTIGSTGSRPSTHGTRAASLSDRALSSWQALKKQPRHDAQGEFKQVLKLLVVLDSCEAAAVWLKWHAAGACSLASHPGASASHPGANTAHRSASIHRRRATVEPQHIAALRCRAHEECVWAG